ncbi:MAG: hypothetical protein I8H86_01120 [Sphingomonadaceae bacterium]|nr:hypothetical protein [Sphingomonadaceae bacterium]
MTSHPDAVGDMDHDTCVRFVKTFNEDDPPKWVLLSGGEPFLRTALIQDIAIESAVAKTKTYVNTGLFFANAKKPSSEIVRAIDGIDHLSISMDPFHEEFVPRQNVWVFIDWFAKRYGDSKGLSIQLCDSPLQPNYSPEITTQVENLFPSFVEVSSMVLQSVGRAQSNVRMQGMPVEEHGCLSIGWPQVSFDGSILPCCTSSHLTSSLPSHLKMGGISSLTWPTLLSQIRERTSLRFIRSCGPGYLRDRFDSRRSNVKETMCNVCVGLPNDLDKKIDADTVFREIILPVFSEESDTKTNQERIDALIKIL